MSGCDIGYTLNGVDDDDRFDYYNEVWEQGLIDCICIRYSAEENIFRYDDDDLVVNIFEFLTPNDLIIFRNDVNTTHIFTKRDDFHTLIEVYRV